MNEQWKYGKPNPFAPKPGIINRDSAYRRTEYLVTSIRDWIDEGDGSFDETFFESVESQFLERGELSQKQMQALENIFEGTVNK
jgi:hypothetical protein